MTSEERSRRLRQLTVAGGLALVLVVAAIVASQAGSGGGDDGAPADYTAEVEARFAGIPQEGLALGDPEARVTLVEYADLQCLFCRDYAVEILPQVVEDYVRAGDVRLEFVPVSILGPDSEAAAGLAAAASLQDRLWQLTDLFYLNQGAENSGYVTEEFLADIAEATPGLDAAVALAQRDSRRAQRVLGLAARDFSRGGFDSTPSFAVGETGARSEPVQVGSLELGEFTSLLDGALARAGG